MLDLSSFSFHPDMIHQEPAVSFLESKSKQGGIEVLMSSHAKDHQDQYRLIDVANRHIDRWTHLRMDGLIHMDDLFCETTPVLPRLRSIEHNNRFHNEYACPYEKWDMPNLSLFVGINVVPVFRVDCNISSLELILKGRSELNEYFHTSYLVDTLATLPRLRSLSLEFQATQCDEIRSSTASLPDLELLNITIKYSTDYTLIKSFISSVSFPNLSQLEILLEEICGEYSADGFLNEILPPFSAVHPRVHTVRIYTSHKFYIGLLQRVFDSVPSVRHLVIDAPNTALLWGNEFFVSAALYNRWPPLQTLRIKRSTRLSERQMEALVDKIHFDGNWDVFQSLQIVSCVGLSEGFLLYMESKMDGKLEWTNVVAAVDEPSENDFD
ncbi:hypothetical protein BD410DRAFT_797565 [Rickenella mellea]|uniref:F-box domain-containing protein n=1 Tax=Rickenella mellea TaxID=50990 RepID=A0A4Y7PEC9_9AGAM|nr:hypothetical protein BD410DRAFT_797565 [Rickenella mellea]